MSIQNLSLNHTDKNKWERMLLIVEQHPHSLVPAIQKPLQNLIIKRLLFNNILILLIQYSGINISQLSPTPSPIWFATGTACAYLFLRGASVLPGIWLGNFLAYYFASTGLWIAVNLSTVLSLQALALRWFCYRYLCPTLIFYQLTPFIKFIVFTAGLTALTSEALVFLYSLAIHDNHMLHITYLHYWFSNFNAILIFSVAYITWDAYFSRENTNKYSDNLLKYTLYFILILITIALTQPTSPNTSYFLALSNLFITIIISTKFSWCEAVTAGFLSGILFSFATFLGLPALNTIVASSTILFIQFLLCTQMIIGLSIVVWRKKHA